MSGPGLLEAAAVAGGAAFGALARWQVGVVFNPVFKGFPLGTWLVNVVGGLLIGVTLVGLQRWPDPLLRLLLVTGVLGGFTTFSSFSAESLALLQAGRHGWALAHTLAHVLASLAAAAAGVALARAIWPSA
ncbi:fluoride efflux transporter CrcB [Leptothrix discophora]|uniref:Fluoride-specific ion channel FluC n=1 Tax=Leptothrix discophora TaxID=89 RepID=A0ABT9FYU7_LEPDI|nr:fluoride efflux transporter CrcB [Leptothrix discophora]MDP4299414.1 fluoride efflux transporter CrcB [Leptothrix discophora]